MLRPAGGWLLPPLLAALLAGRPAEELRLRDEGTAESRGEPGSVFNLKVQVEDLLSHRSLDGALVEVYINHSRAGTAVTGDDGSVLLNVPFRTGLTVTLAASRGGYVRTLLPCTTSRAPVFSSVTMLLHGLTRGNIWLFEDSVLITDETSDPSPQPVVQFPKSLLNLTNGGDLSSYEAFLTFPTRAAAATTYNTPGVVSSASGYVSVDLHPVAAVSICLFSGGTELHVSGPVTISLIIPDDRGLWENSVVPAWLYNQTAGAWMRQGLGTVVLVEGKLRWTFTAPCLGYWIAAPLSSTRGFFGFVFPTDFILQHVFLLLLLLGGLLLVIACLLFGLLHHRGSPGERSCKQVLPLTRRDQSTSTRGDGSPGHAAGSQDGPNQFFQGQGGDQHAATYSVIANPGAAAIHDEPGDLPSGGAVQEQLPASLAENLLFYNQPVAVLHASAFLRFEEQLHPWSRSASPLQAPSSSSPDSHNSPTQTLSAVAQNQVLEPQVLVMEAVPSASRGQHGLQESLSVPQALHKIREKRRSVLDETEASKAAASQPPRAWFVSLEGKPAAELRYSLAEQQRRRRPVESRETSLDSGVDLSELNPAVAGSRRAQTLERNATFVKRSSRRETLQ